MCSFFYLSESCLMDFFIVFSNIFFLSSRLFIHSTKKSTTNTGSTLKSDLRSTLCYSSYTTGLGSTFSTFLSSSPLRLIFFIALSSSSLAYCYFLNFSYKIACFSFSLIYLHLLAISSINILNSGIESIDKVFFKSSIFYFNFSSCDAFSSSSLILSSKIKSASSIKISNNSESFYSEMHKVSYSYSSSFPRMFSFSFSTCFSS